MRPSRFNDEQIVAALTTACGRGDDEGVVPAAGDHGDPIQLKAQVRGMAVSDARELKGLEEENR